VDADSTRSIQTSIWAADAACSRCSGLGGNLGIGLDGAVAFERGAHHLLAELVVAVPHRHAGPWHRGTAEEPPAGRIDGSGAKSR
jgi:hypothetical protein